MIEIKITAENAKELTEKLQELAAGLLAELPEATPKEEPKKKASKKKAEPVEEHAPAPAPAPAVPVAEVVDAAPAVVPTAPVPTVSAEYTQDRVIAGAISFKDKAPQNLGLLQAKLAEFKVMSLQELNQDQLNAFAEWLISMGEVL